MLIIPCHAELGSASLNCDYFETQKRVQGDITDYGIVITFKYMRKLNAFSYFKKA
jgi:hypothetical protein